MTAPKLLAFAAELDRVDALEDLIEKGAAGGATPRELAVSIEEMLSAPVDGADMLGRVEDAIMNTGWSFDGKSQSFSTLVRGIAQEGWLLSTRTAIKATVGAAVLTELRLPSVAMVDAGQREIDAGAKNALRVWLKMWERA